MARNATLKPSTARVLGRLGMSIQTSQIPTTGTMCGQLTEGVKSEWQIYLGSTRPLLDPLRIIGQGILCNGSFLSIRKYASTPAREAIGSRQTMPKALLEPSRSNTSPIGWKLAKSCRWSLLGPTTWRSPKTTPFSWVRIGLSPLEQTGGSPRSLQVHHERD